MIISFAFGKRPNVFHNTPVQRKNNKYLQTRNLAIERNPFVLPFLTVWYIISTGLWGDNVKIFI